MTGTFSGSGASSRTCTNLSSTIRLPLTSRIDALLERFDADPLHGVEKNLIRPLAQFEVGGDDVFHHVRDLGVWHRRPKQRAKLRVLVGAAAERDLVEFLA